MFDLTNYVSNLKQPQMKPGDTRFSPVHTILIFEKFSKPSGVKVGVPSSMKDKSVR